MFPFRHTGLAVLLFLLVLSGFEAQAQSYDLRLLFESPAGARPAVIFVPVGNLKSTISMDPAGLLLTRENDGGLLTGIQTVVPGTREVTWRMKAEEIDALEFTGGVRAGGGIENTAGVFNGLVNLYGDGTRYPVFSGEGKLLVVDPQTNTPAFIVEIDGIEAGQVHAADLTGDGTQELIVHLSEAKVVQIWDDADIIHTRSSP